MSESPDQLISKVSGYIYDINGKAHYFELNKKFLLITFKYSETHDSTIYTLKPEGSNEEISVDLHGNGVTIQDGTIVKRK